MAIYSDYFDMPPGAKEPTPEEEALAMSRLMERYPQMFTEAWRRKLLGIPPKKKKKEKKPETVRTSALEKMLKRSLTKEEIEELK